MLKHLNCTHLNIKSMKNKFASLVNIKNRNTDVLMILESKTDSFYPNTQSLVKSCSTLYQLGRKASEYIIKILKYSILLFEKEDLPSTLFKKFLAFSTVIFFPLKKLRLSKKK